MKFTSIVNKINRKLVARQITFGSDDAQTNDIRALIMSNDIDYTNAHGLEDVIRVRATKTNNTPEKIKILEAIAANLESPAQSWTAAREARINGKRKMVFSDVTDDKGNTITAAEAYRAAMLATMQINYKSVKKTQTAAFTAAGCSTTSSKPCSKRGSNKGNKNGKRPRSIVVSLDIETNQFYNYSEFMNHNYAADTIAWQIDYKAGAFRAYESPLKESMRGHIEATVKECFAIIEQEKIGISAELKKVDYLAGQDVWLKIWNKMEAHVLEASKVYASFKDKHVFIDSCKAIIDDSTYSTKSARNKALASIGDPSLLPDTIHPSHAGVYLIGVTKWEPEQTVIVNGAPKQIPWFEMDKKSFKEMITEKSAAEASGYKHYSYFYTIDTFNAWLKDELDKALTTGETVFLFAHNLSYETNLLLLNCQVIKDAVSEDRVTYLSNNSKDSFKSFEIYGSAPVYDDNGVKRYGKAILEARCSWKLTGSSVDKLGKKYNYQKNGDGSEYDYTKIRMLNPCSSLYYKLTADDYDYNRIDCEIAAIATHDIYNKYKELVKDNTTFYSANNVIKVEGKHDFKEHKIAPDFNQKKRTMDFHQYIDFHETSHGGLVAVNTQLAGQGLYKDAEIDYLGTNTKLKNFYHIDLISAHPSQAFTKLYPVTAGETIDPADFPEIEAGLLLSFDYVDEITKNLNTEDPEEYIKRYAYGIDTIVLMQHYDKTKKRTVNRSGYGVFKLTDVTLRAADNGTVIPCLPIAIQTDPRSNLTKEEEEAGLKPFPGVNIQAESGKLTSADEITISATAEDLVIYSLFYNFNFEIIKFVRYEMGTCNKRIVRQFQQHGGRKVYYKKMLKAAKNKNVDEVEEVYKESNKEAAKHGHQAYIDKEDYEVVKTLVKAGEFNQAIEMADGMLSFAKQQLNGIYGTNYQSMLRRSYRLLLDDDKVITAPSHVLDEESKGGRYSLKEGTEFQEQDKQNIDFMHGAYIAQNTRIDIALYMALAMNLGTIPMYIATDSIYGVTTEESAPNAVKILCSRCYNQQATGFETYTDATGATLRRPKSLGLFKNLGLTNFKAPEFTEEYKQISRIVEQIPNGANAVQQALKDIDAYIQQHNKQQQQIKKSRHTKQNEIKANDKHAAAYNKIIALLNAGENDEACKIGKEWLESVTVLPYANIWDFGGMDLEDEDIEAFAYTMCLKCVSFYKHEVKIKDSQTGDETPFQESKIDITFSGCEAKAFFKYCHKTFKDTGITGANGKTQKIEDCTREDFKEHFIRLTMMNGYASPFDASKGKTTKISNSDTITPEEGYVLAPVPFINNNDKITKGSHNVTNLKTHMCNNYFGKDWSK